MSRRQSTADDFVAWKKLVDGCLGYPIPDLDPLYALPLGLIDTVCEKAPDFWTKEEIRFETKLSLTSGGVFVGKRPYRSSSFRKFLLSDEFEESLSQEQETRKELKKTRIEAVRLEREKELVAAGLKPQKVVALQQLDGEFANEGRIARVAFAGWLISNPTFLTELAGLRQDAPESVGKQNRFPILRLGNQAYYEFICRHARGIWMPSDDREQEFHDRCQQFFRRWCLESIFNWDVPTPMRPSIGSNPPYDLSDGSEVGANVFIPWFALKKRATAIKDLLQIPVAEQLGGHLAPFLKKAAEVRTRVDRPFRLFVFHELAIRRRYGARLAKSPQVLDRAYMKYFGLGSQQRRRIRDPLTKVATDSVTRAIRKFSYYRRYIAGEG